MDIKRKITEAQGLTPTEQQLGIAALAMGEDVRGLSIDYARCSEFLEQSFPYTRLPGLK